LLGQIPYEDVTRPPIDLPQRTHHPDYQRHPIPKAMYVPSVY
jgi:hypothetical protein